MGWLDRLWWNPGDEGGSLDTPKEDPREEEEEEPEIEEWTETWELDVYDAVVEYRNGDIEKFKAYGMKKTDTHVVFNVEPKAGFEWYFPQPVSPDIKYDTEKYNYAVLGRDPHFTEVGTETWEADYKRVDGVMKEFDHNLRSVEEVEDE